jgi:hypothetical protein
MGEPDNGEGIVWLPNSYRPRRLRRITLYRTGALLVLVTLAATFWIVASRGRQLSNSEGAAVIVGIFLLILLLSAFVVSGFPKYVGERGFTSPVRVGTSSMGLHVEYDPSATRSLKRVDWAATFVPWSEISKIDKWMGVWGVAYGVTITPRNSSVWKWRIAQVSSEIVDSIFAAWGSRGTSPGPDTGTPTPLP